MTTANHGDIIVSVNIINMSLYAADQSVIDLPKIMLKNLT